MNRKDTITLAFRLMGVFVLIELMDHLTLLFNLMSYEDQGLSSLTIGGFTTQSNPIVGGISLAVYLVLVVVLIFAAPWLAGLCTGRRAAEGLVVETDARETQIFFIQLAGIVLTLVAFKTLCFQVFSSINLDDSMSSFFGDDFGDFGDDFSSFGPVYSPWESFFRNIETWLGSLFQMMISLWLVFGARGIHAFLAKRAQPKRP